MAERSVQLSNDFKIYYENTGERSPSLQHTTCSRKNYHVSSIDENGNLRVITPEKNFCRWCETVIPEDIIKKVKFICQKGNDNDHI